MIALAVGRFRPSHCSTIRASEPVLDVHPVLGVPAVAAWEGSSIDRLHEAVAVVAEDAAYPAVRVTVVANTGVIHTPAYLARLLRASELAEPLLVVTNGFLLAGAHTRRLTRLIRGQR